MIWPENVNRRYSLTSATANSSIVWCNQTASAKVGGPAVVVGLPPSSFVATRRPRRFRPRQGARGSRAIRKATEIGQGGLIRVPLREVARCIHEQPGRHGAGKVIVRAARRYRHHCRRPDARRCSSPWVGPGCGGEVARTSNLYNLVRRPLMRSRPWTARVRWRHVAVSVVFAAAPAVATGSRRGEA